MKINSKIAAALQELRQAIALASDVLRSELSESMLSWTRAVDSKLLPRLLPETPLFAAVCGGGSAGKSTLFNSLVGRNISPVGGRAGLNRRVLIAMHPTHADNETLTFFARNIYGASAEPFEQTEQLTTPGPALLWNGSAAPPNIVLLDTPDIDTGARGRYENRQLAQQSLEAADIFIYVFTNATYNNRDNTDFIAELLTAVGVRPCFLIYRVYPSFDDADVHEHALTVARNLYGPSYASHVLGIFRADEDNAVAAGQKSISPRPIANGRLTLRQALEDLDGARLRGHIISSLFSECVRQAQQMADLLLRRREALDNYRDALVSVQNDCIRQALSHFPTDRVLRRFADIWLGADPSHIKIMRRTGRIVEWPYRAAAKTLRAVRGKSETHHPPGKTVDPALRLEMDLLSAARQLQQKAVADHLEVNGRRIESHPVVATIQERLRKKNWTRTLEDITSRTEHILSWSQGLESELHTLAATLRQRMGLLDQLRQTFSAALNVIPATAAITYILHTGDPMGAAGLKIKLTGLLGLNDLYALIAIPATAGLKKADHRQLEQMLRPVAQTWLTHKFQVVQALFEEHISGELLQVTQQAKTHSKTLSETIDAALIVCKEAVDA